MEQKCLSDYNNTTLGKVANFGSPLQLIPGWGKDPEQAWQEWTGAWLLKLVYIKIAETAGKSISAPEVSAVTSHAIPLVEKVAVPLLGAATLWDAQNHWVCWAGSHPDKLTPEMIPH